MAAEILSATMVVFRGPLRKKGMLNQLTSMTPRGGVEWSSQQSHLCGGPLQAVQPPRGHTFISFVISITCLPSLNKGVTLPYLTLPYLTPTLSYSFEGKGTLSYTFLGKIVFLPQTHFPSLSKALE